MFELILKNTFVVFLVFIILRKNKCYGSQVLEFSLQPSDVVVSEGNSALLQCEGRTKPENHEEGKILPNIRWRGPDGQDIGIVGDTFRTQSANGSLYISSVEENRGLTGTYQCLLSVDGIGTIVSRAARVSIAKPPELNQESSEIYLSLGQTAYFRCMTGLVNPAQNYIINWIKDDLPLRFDHSRMVKLPSGSLEIDEVIASDRGTYQCNVTSGSFSKLSTKSNLNIKSATGVPESFASPQFASTPISQTVREGDTVTLDCVANGNPKPTIKWLKNGEDIDMNDLDSIFRLVGTGSLQISSIEDKDTGSYQCRASNEVDSLDAVASIQVLVPPKFVYSPSDKTAFIKDELELGCSIHGKPSPVIQWLKNGDLITPNDYMQIVGGNNLKILGLISSDAGMFQCIGTNPAGSVQASARLSIIEPDYHKIGAKNSKKNVKKYNQPLPPPPSLKPPLSPHSKNDNQMENLPFRKTVLDSLVSKDRSNKEGTNFDMTDFVDDDGDYNQNGYDTDEDDDEYNGGDEEGSVHPWKSGDDPNKLLHSIIHGKNEHEISYFSHSSFPPLSRQSKNALDDKKLEIAARIPSAPRDLQAQIVKPRFVTLNWMEPVKNPDEVITYTVFYKMSTSERERKITTKSRDDQEVSINSLMPGKIYQFRVVGNSNSGAGESSEILEVYTQSEENIAGPPENLIGYAISDKEINLTWEPPVTTNGIITKYRIYYQDDENGQEMYTDSTINSSILSDLKPYTEYTISVVPFNQNGMGDPANEIKVKTYSAIPSDSPLNVSLEATSSTSITIRWEPPAPEERNGPITGYKIKYRKTNAISAKKSIQTETTPANLRYLELKELDRMSNYQVKIAAINVNGTGPFTEWMLIETYENDLDESKEPDMPSYIRTRSSSESIAVHWGAPAEATRKVRGYVIGWGKGIPDEFTQLVDENTRYFEITGLEPNNEYVISLSARNTIGLSAPVYDYVRTREDFPVDIPAPLEVPVGLRAITMSSSSIVVYWTDTMLNKNQHVIDNREYVVRYGTMGSTRFKYHNTTELNTIIGDLKANTQYEFAVKVVRGRRESAWSMSVLNSTMQQTAPISEPRDLKTRADDSNPVNVILTWNSPKRVSGQITGYVIFFTTDKSREDRDWSVHAVIGDVHTFTVKNLKPHTTYYFKIQLRTGKILGPFTNIITHTTGRDNNSHASSINMFQELIIYVIIAVAVSIAIIAIIVAYFWCCRKKDEGTPEHAKKSYQKNNAGIIKPPDLWIHHDQMELKNMEKNDGAPSSSGAMTLPRAVAHDAFENEQLAQVTNSLDKRNYTPRYSTTPTITGDRTQQYPRSQYSMPRGHVSMEPSMSQQNLNQSQTNSNVQTPENPYGGYDTMPPSYSNVTYAPGISVDAPKRAGIGQPLKSFGVLIPPPTIGTPVSQNTLKNVPSVTIRPQNASPYKKPPVMSTSMSNRVQTGSTVAHSSDEVERLAPSTSTEELNQEMANLDVLMKDLSAITANEFEC